jgi:hypothetical protein
MNRKPSLIDPYPSPNNAEGRVDVEQKEKNK